jgi:hypothetical protein
MYELQYARAPPAADAAASARGEPVVSWRMLSGAERAYDDLAAGDTWPCARHAGDTRS